MNTKRQILRYRMAGDIQLKCAIRLDRLFATDEERKRFDANQKNAWNALCDDTDLPYDIHAARSCKLKGTLRGTKIPLFGVPPTRLTGPCREVLSAPLRQM